MKNCKNDFLDILVAELVNEFPGLAIDLEDAVVEKLYRAYAAGTQNDWSNDIELNWQEYSKRKYLEE